MENEAEVLAWWAANPLDQWITAHHANLRVICSRLAVSLTALGYWRRGLNRPRGRNIRRLARLMNVAPEALESQWAAWLADRPLEIEKELTNGYSPDGDAAAPVLAADGRKASVERAG